MGQVPAKYEPYPEVLRLPQKTVDWTTRRARTHSALSSRLVPSNSETSAPRPPASHVSLRPPPVSQNVINNRDEWAKVQATVGSRKRDTKGLWFLGWKRILERTRSNLLGSLHGSGREKEEVGACALFT